MNWSSKKIGSEYYIEEQNTKYKIKIGADKKRAAAVAIYFSNNKVWPIITQVNQYLFQAHQDYEAIEKIMEML